MTACLGQQRDRRDEAIRGLLGQIGDLHLGVAVEPVPGSERSERMQSRVFERRDTLVGPGDPGLERSVGRGQDGQRAHEEEDEHQPGHGHHRLLPHRGSVEVEEPVHGRSCR